MIEESQARLQRVLKQKKREAVCAYLAKSDDCVDQKFLSKLIALDNKDEYSLYLCECKKDCSFSIEFKKPIVIGDFWDNYGSTLLLADNFAGPPLIAFMRFCESSESHNPKSCAIFWLERMFSFIKPKNVHLAKNQLDVAIARINNLDDSECIEFVNNSLNDFIEEFLA